MRSRNPEPPLIEAFQRCGVNRVSLGVQSFVDQEALRLGGLHKRTTVLEDIRRLRAAGITNINIDLIAGLPHQTAESWDVLPGASDCLRASARQRLHAGSG